MRVLIVGCGYVGLPLGVELVREGHEVFGLRRTRLAEAELTTAGVKPLSADITSLEELKKLPSDYDWVVNTVSSTKGGVEEYRQVYLHGMRNLLEWLEPAPPKRFVYTSSTSVYGQTDGPVVDETSPAEPVNETSRVLLEAEQVLANQNFPVIILRVAGIYGPGRGYWLQQFLRGEAKIPGHGERILNMVHRDDVVGAIIAALEHGQAGEIYNTVDDEPVTQINLFRWLSGATGRAMPPFSAEAEQARKRGLTNKKVSNRKLKAGLRYSFKYPTFREGFAAAMAFRQVPYQSD
jgi:nucleoside-diphosphate-sugar epimerase